jgi:hypothetical protein
MAYDLALYISTVVLAVVSLWRYRLQLTVVNAFQGAWVLVIAVPSALRYAGVDTAAKERLFVSTTIVNVALLIAVLLRSSAWFQRLLEWLRRRIPEVPKSTRHGLPHWFWAALAVSLGIILVHALLMPKIPLGELILRSDLTANQLAESREAASKLLPLPLAAKYLLNWNVRVLVPILLTVLVLGGRVAPKLLWSSILIGLSAMTLEKSFPIFAIISCGFAVAIHRKCSIASRPVILALLLALGVATGLQTGTKFRDLQARQNSALVATPENDASRQVRPFDGAGGDESSLSWRGLVSYPVRFIRHRILTGPAGVAYAWFEYFPDVFGGFLYGQSWVAVGRTQSALQHPAYLVGLHAYHRKDPDQYLATARAYAAFHADAWANFGYLGVAAASMLVVAILMLTEVGLIFSNSAVTAGASGAALSILLTTLTSGGVQAVLVAQGLLPCLVIALVPIWKRLQGWPGPGGATGCLSC